MITVPISLLISGLAIAVSIYFGISSKKRNDRADTKEETAQMITVLVELKNISAGIIEIKAEINNVKSDRKEDRDKIIRLEESLSSAWKRINEFVLTIDALRKEIDSKS